MIRISDAIIKYKRKINIKIVRKISFLKLNFFGSSIPLINQLIWLIFHKLTKIYFLNRKISKEIYEKFKQKRYIDIGQLTKEDLHKLRLITSRILKNDIDYDPIPREINIELSNLIFKYLQSFSFEISSIFNSNYQASWIDIYKTKPSSKNDPDSSFAWHYDDDPPQLLKFFLYLDKTTKLNGAFRTFDYKSTKNLFKLGFISNTKKDRINSQNLINGDILKNSEWVERDAGSFFCFDNNLIHRGTYPKVGERTVIVVCLYPSIAPLKIENIHNSLALPKKSYPFFPWKNPYIIR